MENPKFDLTILPTDIEDAESASVKGNPLLQAGRLDVAAAQRRRAEVRSGFFPRVDLVGKINREDDVDATRGIRRDWSVLL
jgi:adhesin transport system outer membrane protein